MLSTTENAGPLGRREQNKVDTRRAITDAAFDLARSVGPGAFTVDQIAARAGVSRRTFFNYFHSAEDALTVRTDGFLELALAVFGQLPQDEPLFDSIVRAFSETTRMEGLSQHGELFRMADSNPDLLRAQLHSWERAEALIVEALRRRLGPAASTLYLTALVGCVLSCTKAAMRDWAASTPESGDDSGTQLEARILASLTMLRNGFADPTTDPIADPTTDSTADIAADTTATAQGTSPVPSVTAGP
ncbi:TetR family transcriptional regulator [Arthrobacter agilis]|uniref:TetR family transcriptional regulator n=1 Tax=Arthrobacter agilis TaxID=37921 RepID=A0A2L0UF34_9MICC|nr:TetR/AcrR family transcriptional regulator [Arthrobacter agilis]AUZ87865.1 TetR family transcriptional regulator [Arthrobacter agilis]